MTQHYITTFDTVTGPEEGADVLDQLNQFTAAHKTGQAGSTRPAGIQRGGLWSDNQGSEFNGDAITLKLFDGVEDLSVLVEGLALSTDGGTLGGKIEIFPNASVVAGVELRSNVDNYVRWDSQTGHWDAVTNTATAASDTLVFYHDSSYEPVTFYPTGSVGVEAGQGFRVDGTTVVTDQQAAIASLSVTATTGSLPTPDETVTIADTAAPTNAELLDYCAELEAKVEALLGALRAHGLIAT